MIKFTNIRIAYQAKEACTETVSGRHIIEFSDDDSEAWCCSCAMEIVDADYRRAWLIKILTHLRQKYSQKQIEEALAQVLPHDVKRSR